MSPLVGLAIIAAYLLVWRWSVQHDKQAEDPVQRFIDEEKGSIAGMKRRESQPGVFKRLTQAERVKRRG